MRATYLMKFAALLLFAACNAATAPQGPCDEMCRSLVQDCGYAAYPSLESCRQGCEYNATQGADASAQSACVTEAACDTFAILECEHAYGVE